MGRGGANFREPTKRILAARVGYRCSFEGCDRPTVGPSDESAEEAVETLRPFFLHTPMAFAQWMGVITRVYLGLCEALETAPDAELLGPIEEVLQRLHSEG